MLGTTYCVSFFFNDAATTEIYTLSLHDSLPISGDEGGDLMNGATHAGAIYLGDLDQWSFTATQGDYIALSMGEVAPVSAGLPPWIRPVSPPGVLLRHRLGASAVQLAAAAPPPGAYYVILASNDGV